MNLGFSGCRLVQAKVKWDINKSSGETQSWRHSPQLRRTKRNNSLNTGSGLTFTRRILTRSVEPLRQHQIGRMIYMAQPICS